MRRIAALACALSLLLPTPARAGEPAPPSEIAPEPSAPPDAQPAAPVVVGGDEVRLHDGGFVRGQIEEYERGSHVVIVKSDGTRRRIDWSAIAAVDLERDRKPAGPGSTADTPPATSTTPPPADDHVPAGSVRFHMVLEGPNGETSTLYRQTGTAFASGPGGVITAESASVLCTYPCGQLVSTSLGAYYINRADDGPIMRSKVFGLGGRTGDVTAHVRPGNRPARVIGFTLTMLSIIFAVIGPTYLGIAAGSDDEDTRSRGFKLGGAFTGIGVGGLIVGIPLMVRGRNRVRLENGRPR